LTQLLDKDSLSAFKFVKGPLGVDDQMRLDRVQIANFRSIKSITINFDPKCRVLVGINESGKSNILKALSLLNPTQEVTPDDLRIFPSNEDPSQSAFVRFIFKLEKDERTASYERLRNKVLLEKESEPILEVGGKKLSLAQFVDSRTDGLHIIDIRERSRTHNVWRLPDDYKVIGIWKKPSKKCPSNYQVVKSDGSVAQLRSFSLVHAKAVADVPEEYLESIAPEDVNFLAKTAIAEIVVENLPDCLYWSYSDAHLLPSQIRLDAFAADPDICMPLKHMFALAGITNILGEITAAQARSNGIRNLLNRVAVCASRHIKSVWKEYRGLTIELSPNGAYIDASVKDEHNLYDFARRSDGFKRFISFLLMVSAKDRTGNLTIDLCINNGKTYSDGLYYVA